MASLWAVDFETGDLSQVAGVTGTVTVTAAAAHAGSYGARIASAGNYCTIYPSGQVAYGALWVKLSSDFTLPAYNAVSLVNQKIGGIWRNVAVSAENGQWNFNGNVYTTNYSLNEWHFVELLTDVTNSIITCRIDGTELYSGNGGFSWSGASGFEKATLGTELGAMSTGTIDFDDWLGDDADWPSGGGGVELAESATATELQTAQKSTTGAMSESVSSEDAQSALKITSGTQIETTTAEDEQASNKSTQSAILETASAVDVTSTENEYPTFNLGAFNFSETQSLGAFEHDTVQALGSFKRSEYYDLGEFVCLEES